MKFATLQQHNEASFVALIDDGKQRYWPVAELVSGFTGGMSELIEGWDTLKPQIKPVTEGYALEKTRIDVPLRARRNVFCVGKNYHQHAAEFSKSGFDHSAKEGEVAPEFAVVFTKTPETLIAHRTAIPLHANVTHQLDYEAELAVIIGKAGKGIAKADALQHVWGYTIINDVTARDLQKNHRQWFIGKSLDGLGPIGPWIATADDVDLSSAKIQCWVNGELRQNANLGELVFDVPTLIETLSAGMELKPGDIIATGTPAGVGIGFTPARFLQAGDAIRIEIAGIGVLENEVGQ